MDFALHRFLHNRRYQEVLYWHYSILTPFILIECCDESYPMIYPLMVGRAWVRLELLRIARIQALEIRL